jgi:hypothetical protein
MRYCSQRRIIIMILYCWILICTACAMDDSDRCSGDLLWNRETLTCVAAPEDAGTDSDHSNDPTDAGLSDGSTTGTEGLNEPCHGNQDCASFDEDYCVINPLQPDQEGYCTITDCTKGNCPDGYQCCDCTNQAGYPIACFKDADAALISAICNWCE